VALRIDLGDPASIAAAAKTAKDATLLVNNAGALEFGSQVSAALAGIRRDFETNYFGTLQVTRAFVPVLEANRNSAIVNVLAVVSLVSIPGLGGYSASKAAVIAMSKSLAKELVQSGVIVNTVTPAAVRTPIFEQLTQAHIDFMLAKIPAGRFGTVCEVASLIAWLASRECSFSTGAAFDISGGRSTY